MYACPGAVPLSSEWPLNLRSLHVMRLSMREASEKDALI